MASATGIPEQHPTTVEAREDEPLLGTPGAVTQKEGVGIHHNLITGASAVSKPTSIVDDAPRIVRSWGLLLTPD